MAPKKSTEQQILDIVTRVETRMGVLEEKFVKLEELHANVEILTKECREKDAKIQHLETRLDNLDADRRRRNVVIHDLPSELVTEQSIIEHITTHAELDVQPSSALRTSSRGGKAGPVIIKFDRERDAAAFINTARTEFKVKRDLPPNIRNRNRTKFLDNALEHLQKKGKAATVVGNAIQIDGRPITSEEFRTMTKQMFHN